MLNWGDLFTARQKLNLCTLVQLTTAKSDASNSIRALLAFIVSRAADRLATLVGWDTTGEKVDHVFKRQALPMTWDFAEGVPIADASGGLEGILEQILGTVEDWAATNRRVGQATLADAAKHPLPSDSARIWFTDPPYYDAVPYADLSDFFFVWLKRALLNSPLLRDPFQPDNPLTPKTFETSRTRRSSTMVDLKIAPSLRSDGEGVCGRRRVLREDGVGSVVFAHKTTEGWEALLVRYDSRRVDDYCVVADRHRAGASAARPRIGGARH